MKNGLWTSPTEYLDFSETEIAERQALLEEMYSGSSVSGFDPIGWLGLLPDPDPVLKKTGEGVEILRSLLADDKVISCIQNRKIGVLKKEDFLWEPGHEKGAEADARSKALCDALTQDLESVDLYNLFSQILDAPYYGATFVEIIWRAENGRLRIDKLKPRPLEWFRYNGNHEPVFRGKDQLSGAPIPFGKIMIARHFPDAVNPYGLRLLSRCLWPVAIKKGGIRFWTTLCERFGMPWVIGKVDGDAAERKKALTALTAMVQDAVAVVSGKTEVEMHGLEGQGGELHPKLVQYCDLSIARALMGQDLTSEGKNTGTYAESQTSMEALGDFQSADENLILKFMRDLAYLYRELNDSSARYPNFRFKEPEDYAALAELDTKLHGVGVRFTPKHFERRYNLSDDEFTMTEETTTSPEPMVPDKTELASPSGGFSKEQQAIEDLADALLRRGAKTFSANEKKILSAVQTAGSYEEAMENLLDLFPELSMDGLTELVEQGVLNSDLYGRWTVNQENGPEE
ncbi:MAG: DUF935 family protein [Pseudomonadota bacterium]